MKRSTYMILLFLSCTLPLTAHSDERTKVKIGFIVSLTGSLAEFGEAIRNGATLAVEDTEGLNDKLELIYEDSQYDSKKALSALKKLDSIDKVDAVYLFGGPMSDALSPVSESLKLPTFSTEYDTRYTKGRKYVFRFANNASDYATALADVLKEREIKKVAIIKEENQYHNTLSSAFQLIPDTPWETELLFSFLPGETDFRGSFPKLTSTSYDALGIYLTPPLQRSYLTQLKQAGIRLQFFGTDSFDSPMQNKGLEDVIEGSLFANSNISDDFQERYIKRFGNDSQLVHAALAYEFIKLFGQILKNPINGSRRETIVKRVQFHHPRKSVCGEYFFRNSEETGKYFSFPIAVRELKNGKAKAIAVIDAP